MKLLNNQEKALFLSNFFRLKRDAIFEKKQKEDYMKSKNAGRLNIGPNDAFMVIDLNKDALLESGKLFVRGLPGEIAPQELISLVLKINQLPFGFRFVVSDMHPPGHIEAKIYREHAVKGTSGQEWPEELKELYDSADFRLVKGMEKELVSVPLYTGKDFFLLIPLLRKSGIKRIFSAGIAYDFCLGESAIALSLQHFEVFVIRDAAPSVPPPNGSSDTMKKKLELYHVAEISSTNLV
jgi:nicotinamidase/pyrazinamidase